MSEMRLFDPEGRRLYLNADERAAFLKSAARRDPQHRAFAEMLHFTGCRISEALEVTPERIDLSDNKVILRSLKKRRQDVFRAVPLPPEYIDSLQRTFSLRQAQKRQKSKSESLWPWHRQYGWQLIKDVMQAADIADGPHQTAKGLRHAYGIHAISKGIPVTSVQKWLGHAQLSTTAIYVDFVGAEASDLAARMWE
jgi:integrase/recombinase XerD|tara:strand:- start:14000 stop:14587 length:588 start_codon:yes stop_codon:yes gene_type:complete